MLILLNYTRVLRLELRMRNLKFPVLPLNYTLFIYNAEERGYN